MRSADLRATALIEQVNRLLAARGRGEELRGELGGEPGLALVVERAGLPEVQRVVASIDELEQLAAELAEEGN